MNALELMALNQLQQTLINAMAACPNHPPDDVAVSIMKQEVAKALAIVRAIKENNDKYVL